MINDLYNHFQDLYNHFSRARTGALEIGSDPTE